MPKKKPGSPPWRWQRSKKRYKILQAKHKDWNGTAEAIWRWLDGEWRFSQASPAIDWLAVLSPDEAEVELRARRWTFKWL
jgi:hypothetical protein